MKKIVEVMKHIFLSPHLDDAVASCGGLIGKLIYQREKVLVLTVFTKDIDLNKVPQKFHKFARYKERKEEDKKAMNKLSADYKWLDITERAYREPIPKRPTGVFKINLSAGLSHFPNIARIQEEISRAIDESPNSIVYSPLGIGNHFDHVEVFIASLMYMVDYALYDQFRFYVDFYGMASTKIRKKHYLGKKLIRKGFKKPEKSSLRFFIITSVINSMISGSSIERLFETRYKSLNWELEPISIHGYENLKFSAFECYESQIKLLGRKQARKATETYHQNWDNCELYLKAKPTHI